MRAERSRAWDDDEGIALINSSKWGNGTAIFTRDGGLPGGSSNGVNRSCEGADAVGERSYAGEGAVVPHEVGSHGPDGAAADLLGRCLLGDQEFSVAAVGLVPLVESAGRVDPVSGLAFGGRQGSGAGMETVKECLGHASITTTIDTYGHLTVEDARRTLEAAGWFTGREVRL